MACQVNESKQHIDELKAAIEKGRIQRALPRLGKMSVGGGADFALAEPDADEIAAKEQIELVRLPQHAHLEQLLCLANARADHHML